MSVVGRRPFGDTVDPLRHRGIQLRRDTTSTAKPEDESVTGRALAFQTRLTDIRVADADSPQPVDHADVEATDEWTRLVSSEEPRAINEQPVIPAHRLIFTQ